MKSIFYISALLVQIVLGELIFVQQLFRHGARYPITPTEKDGTEYALIDNKAGQLTSLGKRQHYQLGQKLKNDYWGQLGLNNTYNSTYFYVKSTNVNRTLESAQSQFIGWVQSLNPLILTQQQAILATPPWFNKTFNTSIGNVFPNSPKFKPHAIHSQKLGATILNSGDFLHSYKKSNCPTVQEWRKQGQKSQIYKNVSQMSRVKGALVTMQKAFNDKTIELQNIPTYFSNYQCSKSLGKRYSQIFDGQYSRQYSFIRTFVRYSQLAQSDIQINSTVTGLFNTTLNNMKSIIQNKQKQKIILYSAHDHTLVVTLAGLRMGSMQCVLNHYKNPQQHSQCIFDYPDVASSLIFQLHLINGSYLVKLRYNDKYLKMPFCSNIVCPFNQFTNHLQTTIRSTYSNDCGIFQTIITISKQNGYTIANIILGFFLLSAAGYELYLFIKQRMPKKVQSTYFQQVQDI